MRGGLACHSNSHDVGTCTFLFHLGMSQQFHLLCNPAILVSDDGRSGLCSPCSSQTRACGEADICIRDHFQLRRESKIYQSIKTDRNLMMMIFVLDRVDITVYLFSFGQTAHLSLSLLHAKYNALSKWKSSLCNSATLKIWS